MKGTRRGDPDTTVTAVIAVRPPVVVVTPQRGASAEGWVRLLLDGKASAIGPSAASRSSEVAARHLQYENHAYTCMQAESLKGMASEAQHAAQHAEGAKRAAEAEMVELRSELQATQARMAVLKEQLMTGQAAAEESEAQVVQDAVQRIEAELTEKLRESQREVCKVCVGNLRVRKNMRSSACAGERVAR